jgi:hypothetical protein
MHLCPITLICCILPKSDEYVMDSRMYSNDVAYNFVMRALPSIARPRQSHLLI